MDNNQLFLKKLNIPSNLNYIQPLSTNVWNCDEIGFDPNGHWNEFIYTYKCFSGELMWKIKTGE